MLHPFSQLTAEEIRQSSKLLRQLHPNDELQFKAIALQEPCKQQALEYLKAEHGGSVSKPVVDRFSFVNYYKRNQNILYEAIINLKNATIVYDRTLDKFHHDPSVRAALAKIGIEDMSLVICEPWIYGSDGINDERRQYQCFTFLRDPRNPSELDSNHYARPLPICPVFDVTEGRVTRIDTLPMGADNSSSNLETFEVPPPNEYMPQYQKLRTGLTPLNVVQPQGPSFTVTEDFAGSHVVEWQKWRFRLGFNAREGMVLHDIRYDGRELFYQLSLSDMNIPYADPRHPYHKKAAFDLGDAGAGYTANNLRLGCDCLGAIFYLSAVLANANGDVIEQNNCVCIHEQDSGIGWKHTNYRTGHAAVTRARELVLQSILTVANYEYILAFIFSQAGDITYEVRATGILSTQPIHPDVDVPWGTVVHPGVLAAHHQHIFSLRIDSMLDGIKNKVSYVEAHSLDYSELNPHGTGYYTREVTVERSGAYDLDIQKNRVFMIKSSTSKNPINRKECGYKIMVPDFQKMLADLQSFNHKRAEFGDHNIYVTKYRPNQLYAAGQYTNQSRGGSGVRKWASALDPVVDEDIVVWVQFGINHIPRIEDFPVMPTEILKVHLRPSNFFTKNPALDVPPSVQEINKSSLVSASREDERAHKEAVNAGHHLIRRPNL